MDPRPLVQVRTTGAWLISPGRHDTIASLVDRLMDGWEDERAPPICVGVLPWEALDAEVHAELKERPAGTCFKVTPRPDPITPPPANGTPC